MVFLLTAVAFFAYMNILDAPFAFDDRPNIAQNPNIRMSDLTMDSVIRGTKGPSPFRPVAYLSFSLNYYFGRYNVTGYHLVNIIILITTAFLVFLITGHTLRLTGIDKGITPQLAALVWLVNPLHTQSITYTVQRVNSLAALFFLLGLYFYISARLTQRSAPKNRLKTVLLFSGSIVSGLLALFSKEIAATLPVIIVLYEWFFFRNLRQNWIRKPARWFILAGMIMIPIVVLSMKASLVERILSSYDSQIFTLDQRLLTEPRVIVYYLSLLLFPHPDRLNVDYDFPLSTSLCNPFVTTLALAAIIALITAAVYRPERHRLLSFALLWFLGNLVIESSFIGLAVIFEHRTYLPSIFPVFVLVAFIIKHTPRPLATVTIGLALVAGIFWTYQRNEVWRDRLTLWQDCARKTPRQARPANGVGLAYQARQQPEKALAWFQKAIQLGPDYHEAYSNIGGILVSLDHAAEALPYLERAVTLDPESHVAFTNLGSAMTELNRIQDAIHYYQKAIRIYPEYETAHNNLGTVLLENGDIESALRHLQRAIDINPEYYEPYNNLGTAMIRLDRPEEAITWCQKALALNPAYAPAHYNLGIAWLKEHEPVKAIAHFQQAVRIDPKSVPALNQMATIRVEQKEYEKAVQILNRLTELLPESTAVYYNLACVHALAGNKNKALASLQQAVERGYDRWEHMKSDPDLKNIYDTDYFKSLTR